MIIRSNEGNLLIDNCVGGIYEMAISEISNWKLLVKENGAIYFSFSLDGCTQHVSVVTRDPVELKRDISELTKLLSEEPLLNLKHAKLDRNFNEYSGTITMELLFGILALSSGC